jgi:GH43 family beta-xylosidase
MSTYRNPLFVTPGMADPTMLEYGGTYYLYGSVKENRVYTAPAMHGPWTAGPAIVTGTAGMHYAPHVVGPVNGVFYDYYVEQGRNCVATGPGPTQLSRRKALVEGGGDPWFFKDDDGQLYFYYAIWVSLDANNNPAPPGTNSKGQAVINVCKMSDPLTLVPGAHTRVLIQTPAAAWERGTVENPCVFKRNGIYYMLYAAGNFAYTYATGYATATNPLGPWTKYSGNPIMQNVAGTITGPGACSVIADKAGELWAVYHQKYTHGSVPGYDRVVCLDRLVFTPNSALSIRATRGTDEIAPAQSGVPTPTPTPAPTPTPTPAPVVVAGIAIGDRVEVAIATGGRANPRLVDAQILQLAVGAQGIVLSGPVSADALVWWRVNFTGAPAPVWVRENRIVKVVLPSPSPSPSPAPVVPTPAPPPAPPTVPLEVVAFPVSSSQITLLWGAVADAHTYWIKRDGVTVATVGGTVTTYTDTELQAGITYVYAVVALISKQSVSVSATTE